MVWLIMDGKVEDGDEDGDLAICPRLVEFAFVGPSEQPRFWKVSMLHAVTSALATVPNAAQQQNAILVEIVYPICAVTNARYSDT